MNNPEQRGGPCGSDSAPDLPLNAARRSDDENKATGNGRFVAGGMALTDNATPLAPSTTPAAPPPGSMPAERAQVVCVARPMVAQPARSGSLLANTDRLAIASLVCGLTAIIPLVSQVAGVGLGIWSLVRIRRVRRAGGTVGGTWAAGTGIAFSAVVLLCWVLVIGAMLWAGVMFDEIGSKLPTGTPPM